MKQLENATKKKQKRPTVTAYLIITLIKIYQLCISPLLGQNCRFVPSCSQYALEAFREKPFFTACWMTCKRLIRCNPWTT